MRDLSEKFPLFRILSPFSEDPDLATSLLNMDIDPEVSVASLFLESLVGFGQL